MQRRQAHCRLPRSAPGSPCSFAVPWDPITNIISFAWGANFVVVSGTTLDFDFHKARGISAWDGFAVQIDAPFFVDFLWGAGVFRLPSAAWLNQDVLFLVCLFPRSH
ncbi:hypothetical protein LINPERPRIM_LOCUS24125 [Linum perenne]